MAIRTLPGFKQQLINQVLTELAARQEQEEIGAQAYQSDIADWGERHFFIPQTGDPIIIPLHQKAVLRYFFTRRENGHFPFQNIVYSSIKKSGKSTIAGLIARWYAETQGRYKEIMTIGNDLEQAKERSFKEVVRSLEMTPGFNYARSVLPGRWWVNKLSLRCILNGSTIKAIAVDAKGEAGGQQSMTIWTELWGAEDVEAKRFWDEMQPIPTVPDSLRLVETYAGYDGESELLKRLYDSGMEGRQLTAGEVADIVCRPDIPGQTFQDFVDCWHETKGDPDVLIPIWSNPQAGIGMYWDSGMAARRMPWQHMPIIGEEIVPEGSVGICDMCKRTVKEHYIGETAEQYYRVAEAQNLPQVYRRLHLNEWVGAESQFVPMESWDACGHVHDIAPIQDGDRTMLVVSADAAVTGDCFGIVAVTRCPKDPDCVDVRALKKWDPKESGGVIDMQEAEDFLRKVCKMYNVVQIAYDPYQLENMAQRLRKDGVAWVEPFVQAGDRLKADSQLYDMVISRRVHHSNQTDLREHIANANAKVQPNEDSKLRIVKKTSGKKIDLCVALSMAVSRCLYLRIPTAKIAQDQREEKEMPASPTLHYNTPKNDNKTRCGRKLNKVQWRTDIKDVTCNRCLQLVKLD